MNNNKLAAEYSRVLNAVKRKPEERMNKLFQGISKLRDQWENKGKKWPGLIPIWIYTLPTSRLPGQIMLLSKGLGLNNLRNYTETYNFLRQAKNAGYWAYMANRGEVTARAVAHVFDNKLLRLKKPKKLLLSNLVS